MLALLIRGGIYVISGRWAADRPARDLKAIKRSLAARRRGFWTFTLYGDLPASIVVVILSRAIDQLRSMGNVSFSSAEFVADLPFALIVALLHAIMRWRSLHASAAEVLERNDPRAKPLGYREYHSKASNAPGPGQQP